MSNEETKIALMQQEISYIKEKVDAIVDELKANNQLQQEKMFMFQEQMDKRFIGVHERLDTKADKVDLEKINTVISRIAWAIVLSVLGAILALVINSK